MAKKHIDVFGVGVACVDDIIYVKRFPGPNEKHPVVESVRQGGGLCGTALVAASRLGCSCAIAIRIGDDDLSNFVRNSLKADGIEILEDPGATGARPYHSVVITEKGSGERSILFDDIRALPPRIGGEELALAVKAGCLFVDHVFAPQVLGAAKAARDAGVPVVGDFERNEAATLELMALTDHVILPLGFAGSVVSETTPDRVVRALLRTPGRALACVTDSERGCWFGVRDDPDRVIHQPAFTAEAVIDTTGCGDVFHGAYAACLVQGMPPSERIRRAAAAACIKTGRHGAQAGAPTRAELEAFLAKA